MIGKIRIRPGEIPFAGERSDHRLPGVFTGSTSMETCYVGPVIYKVAPLSDRVFGPIILYDAEICRPLGFLHLQASYDSDKTWNKPDTAMRMR